MTRQQQAHFYKFLWYLGNLTFLMVVGANEIGYIREKGKTIFNETKQAGFAGSELASVDAATGMCEYVFKNFMYDLPAFNGTTPKGFDLRQVIGQQEKQYPINRYDPRATYFFLPFISAAACFIAAAFSGLSSVSGSGCHTPTVISAVHYVSFFAVFAVISLSHFGVQTGNLSDPGFVTQVLGCMMGAAQRWLPTVKPYVPLPASLPTYYTHFIPSLPASTKSEFLIWFLPLLAVSLIVECAYFNVIADDGIFPSFSDIRSCTARMFSCCPRKPSNGETRPLLSQQRRQVQRNDDADSDGADSLPGMA